MGRMKCSPEKDAGCYWDILRLVNPDKQSVDYSELLLIGALITHLPLEGL